MISNTLKVKANKKVGKSFPIVFGSNAIDIKRRIRDIVEKLKYSASRSIGSRIIESAAYCNQILLVPLHILQQYAINGG